MLAGDRLGIALGVAGGRAAAHEGADVGNAVLGLLQHELVAGIGHVESREARRVAGLGRDIVEVRGAHEAGAAALVALGTRVGGHQLVDELAVARM